MPSVKLENGIMVRRVQDHVQLVPEVLRQTLFNSVHSGPLAAHLGVARMIKQLKHYYWPGMSKDIQTWCQSCHQCQKGKGPPAREHGPLQKVITAEPMDIVAIDILYGLQTASDGSMYILVTTDYFTKWPEAYALPDFEAYTCMTALYNNFFARFGLPRQIHSDQGKKFESKLFSESCKIAGIEKSRTTPFYPRSDRQMERMNRTLLQMLRSTASENASNWPQFLPPLISAYRMSTYSITGFTPNMSMLGREVLLPATLIAQPPDETSKPVTPYAISFCQTLRDVHHRVRQATGAAVRIEKLYLYFDKYVKGSPLHVGRFVWLYWPRPPVPQQKKKLTRLWSGPWKIIAFQSAIVVIIRHLKNGKQQTVHIDRVAPCRSQEEQQIPHTATRPSSTPRDLSRSRTSKFTPTPNLSNRSPQTTTFIP